ncbi:1-alkyl-2-acetylglycerophosphocholine esterase [Parastagonospora nodorum]|uniref:1-alkyl-2-acetylglycerophosphocholine esterase n=1 Tax=Phaeosphaeria nodorum (strain SN15 / ATCC MYA-4574 / FGSC 10173) TaxID=321614 RepID=A0A7U2HYS2_PHANO|nr:1-alkyl-2-acetylglycerophosphocholine esterase [Parastagonospora nodorum]QRC93646.1 1-alkyl-2-acetylglycerophosphocholine esterase [Parastagonospora nodorum SN15]KAH3932677.1 1-alkyl-2-acetylglycerophosphocholine esterase [Parastagonospora nodorum]KAH3955053.1 1-alkyl-2-acetylglycerophosphocholine esterase [Parastagonospora nodorum]KAH4040588.1 1-alkyl-2-acetylglycerophosphocholine esterase [Parastagonospora nodorum]
MLLLSVLLTCATAFAQNAIVLPRSTGPYATTLAIEEWVDSSRVDPFNSSHARRIMISRFDPVPISRCNFEQVQYMTNVTAAAEDEILGDYGWPKGLLRRFVLEVCKEKCSVGGGEGNRTEKWPVALFSGGLNTTRLFYSHLAQEVASHGFIVIMIDHPYDTDVVEFPNGDVIFGGSVASPVNGSEPTSLNFGLEVRAQDASFVLDCLGISADSGEKAVIFGHSFGGAASATALLNDKRFRAGINLDGKMYGPVLNSPLGTPKFPQAVALWGSDGHNSSISSDPSWATFWNTLNSSANVDYKREFTVTNAAHGSYWDLNILVDVAGIRGNVSEDTLLYLIGPIPGPRVWEILGRYIPSFFWYTLGLKGEDAVLKGKNQEFPEVQILNE